MKQLRNVTLSCLVFATCLVACTIVRNTRSEAIETMPLKECHLTLEGYAIRLEAQCGTLDVYEDQTSQSGRKISLNVAIIPAVSRNPAPDPLFFLSGGPGQAATETYPLLSTAFDAINQKRSIVLVDQRGTGKSNPLNCPEMDDPLSEKIEEKTLTNKRFQDHLKDCLEELDADPRLYTTSQAIEDLEAVRSALGYQKINLYGVSYGTRVAMRYLYVYPEHVRSVILDGIVPMDDALGTEVAKDAQRSLDAIFQSCSQDLYCNHAFPDLARKFQQMEMDLERAPVELKIPHPVTGEPRQMIITKEKFDVAIRFMTYAPETSAILPLLIHTLSQSQDYSHFGSQYLILTEQISGSISNGVNYSVICTEDAPFIDPEEVSMANNGAYLGDMETDTIANICQVWPRGEVPENFKSPVTSNVPALLLSGEFDPVTPPENADKVARGLSNSLNLVARGQGHNIIFRGCLPQVAAKFINDASVNQLDVSCVDEIQPVPFFINYNGPLQ